MKVLRCNKCFPKLTDNIGKPVYHRVIAEKAEHVDGLCLLAEWEEDLDFAAILVAHPDVRRCRVCGCTDHDCSQCIEKTGEPCYWVEDDLCSVCAEMQRNQEPERCSD